MPIMNGLKHNMMLLQGYNATFDTTSTCNVILLHINSARRLRTCNRAALCPAAAELAHEADCGRGRALCRYMDVVLAVATGSLGHSLGQTV